jgi:hypothetical protein
MKKILIAFNPPATAIHIITFAIQFAKQNSAEIQAVYLSGTKETINSNYPFPNDLSMAEDISSKENISQDNRELIEDHIKALEKECELNGIRVSVGKNITVEELINKTKQSDLLIIDSESEFTEHLLTKAHCPAFITSTDKMPEKVILMYDNSLSGKIAVEIYISLFPQFTNLPTYLFSINAKQEDELEIQYFKEKLKPRISNITLQVTNGNKKNEFKNFIAELDVPVLAVMATSATSALSHFFHPSLVKIVLNEKNISLFIVNNEVRG